MARQTIVSTQQAERITDRALRHIRPIFGKCYGYPVTQRRTLRELGHEVGRSVPRMSRIAKQYGIPIRPPTAAGRARHLSESH